MSSASSSSSLSDTITQEGARKKKRQLDDPPEGEKRAKRYRHLGDEEQAEIVRLGNEIDAIEKRINDNAGLYEQSRKVLALGVSSLAAKEHVEKMDALLSELSKLKSLRQSAMDERDDHLMAVMHGDERAVALEDVRDSRKKEEAVYGRSSEKKQQLLDEEEAAIRLAESRRSDTRTGRPRANAANCPNECKDLIEDMRSCSMICPDCGFVYEDLRCNLDNKFCTMGKFGEHVDVPRRRSGGYKPLNHFAEIVGYFQGTRKSSVPRDVLQRVREFCERYKYEPREVTTQVVKWFLRRMQQDENNRHAIAIATDPKDKLKRYTDFYRCAMEIAHQISGVPPPYMSPMQEDRVLALSPLVLAAYKTSPRYQRLLHTRVDCVKKFPNNLNCSLVFYKICQLLGYDELLPYIPLPKSIDNIDDNDMEAWAHICEVNGWLYIPTR